VDYGCRRLDYDRTHGQQFKARFLKTSAPTSAEGIEKYLGSGMIRGIGPVYAKKLLRAFGDKVFDVIEAEPGRLRDVEGIGPVRANRIVVGWAEQKVVREIMVFLHSHGVGAARAVRIYKTYGADAVQVMSENPYRLARDIRGIGFKTADAIAMKFGVDKTAMIRVRAGISYALTEAMDEGHCGLPTAELTPLAEKLLDVPQDLIITALDLELGDGTVIADRLGETPCVFLAGLYRAERAIADRLLTLNKGTLPWPWINPGKAIPWVERRTGLTLAESQKAAVGMALGSKVLVITGGPGAGKTTIVNAILRIFSAKHMSLLLCAPTGRAAKRMNEATGLEAKTIHRLLEVDPKGGAFRRDDPRSNWSRYSLMFAARITLPHIPVSSDMNLPNSAGELGHGVPPRSASRALILGSARAELISLLRPSMISAGVFLGTPTPTHALAS
jgi:exodeoxyribonuclease V alpha subunit